MVMEAKRGQAAAGAAVLIAIIAGLLIMFVILIPPQERAELLGETDSSSSGSKTVGLGQAEKNLLTENPGRIDYLAQKQIEHPLPITHIYTQTESKILAEKKIAYAKKGIFSEETTDFSFSIPDLANTVNLLLNLRVVNINEGKLIITLNEEIIYSAYVDPGTPVTLSLPQNLLAGNNLLNFAVSSPGIAFWKTFEVSLEDVMVVADVTSVSAQSSKNIFLISETEIENLDRVLLKFQPECKTGEVGKLTIKVNSNQIYQGIPDCDIAMVPIEFSFNNLYQGENEITFHTEKGNYFLSHMMVESKLKDVDFPTYYFELSHEEYLDVQDEEKRVRLNLDFVDVVVRKRGDLVVNGHVYHFDTKEVSYLVDISDDVVKGLNALKIRPKKTLEIRELRADLIK